MFIKRDGYGGKNGYRQRKRNERNPLAIESSQQDIGIYGDKDESVDPKLPVCDVGTTKPTCLLRSADRKKPDAEETVEAWGNHRRTR